jgi:hypothetical protein
LHTIALLLFAFLIPAIDADKVGIHVNADVKFCKAPQEQRIAPDAYHIHTVRALEADCLSRISKAKDECELEVSIAKEHCQLQLSEIEKGASRKKEEDSFDYYIAAMYSPLYPSG